MLKRLLRRITPTFLLDFYHLFLAKLSAVWYGNPSEQLVVIGVTGTNGKSSTVNFIGHMLESMGKTVGWTSTANFSVAGKEWTNDKKMTMLGRFQTQKLLREMVDAGCTHAVVETSSQGIAQSRHIGINYDVVVFTNLTPEHIEAHGGFDAYKEAKGKLFAHAKASKRKTIDGKDYPKTSVINIDVAHAAYFLSFGLDVQYGYGLADAKFREHFSLPYKPVLASWVEMSASGSKFQVDGQMFRAKPIGQFNVYNMLAAVAALRAVGFGLEELAEAVARLEPVPGRMEQILEGQPFSVIVDYAYEPAAFEAIYAALRLMPRKRLIHLLGSAGGGRDIARRAILGDLAAKEADIVIVANEDPYDDDPAEIVEQVAEGARLAGKRDGKDLFVVLDRHEAIQRAIQLALPGDLVLLTGKGSEPVMAVANGEKIPWDDRAEARAAIHDRFDA